MSVQAVRQLFYPCAPLPRQPGDERGSRLVVIVDNPDRLSWRQLGIDTLGNEIFDACAQRQPSTMKALAQALL